MQSCILVYRISCEVVTTLFYLECTGKYNGGVSGKGIVDVILWQCDYKTDWSMCPTLVFTLSSLTRTTALGSTLYRPLDCRRRLAS